MTTAPLAVESARALADCMTETRDRAVVLQLIRTRTGGGRVPSWHLLPPLGRVAAGILDGDGTDDAAVFWRDQAAQRVRAVRMLRNRAHVRKTWRRREPELARTWENELTAILAGEMTP